MSGARELPANNPLSQELGPVGAAVAVSAVPAVTGQTGQNLRKLPARRRPRKASTSMIGNGQTNILTD